MPRKPRVRAGGMCYYGINRGNNCTEVFHKEQDKWIRTNNKTKRAASKSRKVACPLLSFLQVWDDAVKKNGKGLGKNYTWPPEPVFHKCCECPEEEGKKKTYTWPKELHSINEAMPGYYYIRIPFTTAFIEE